MTDHLLQILLTNYIIFPSTLTYYEKHVQKKKKRNLPHTFAAFPVLGFRPVNSSFDGSATY